MRTKQIYLVIMKTPDNVRITTDGYPTIEAARKKLAEKFHVESVCNAFQGRKKITDTLEYDFFLYQGPDGRDDWQCSIESINYHTK